MPMRYKGSLNFIKLLNFSDNFVVLGDKKGGRFIASSKLNFLLRIKPGGYIPKSGLLLGEYIGKFNCGSCVLDIGTGEIGFLAHCMLANGASNVFACDKDREAILHAQNCSKDAKKITWIESDVFSNIHGRFDCIVSNPPQMPMLENKSLHDSGGRDGRYVILKILESASRYLTPNGRLIFSCFDFLGAVEQFNEQLSIIDVALTCGLSGAVVGKYQRFIRRGGETEKNFFWIQKIYPKYNFMNTSDGIAYNIFILEFKQI